MPNENDTPVFVDPNDTEAVKKALETTSAQKAHWRTKAVDPSTGKTYKELFEEAMNKNKPQPINNGEPTGKENTPPTPSAPDNDSFFDHIDVLSPLSPEERTELRATAKDLNVDPIKFIKSKAGQAQLDGMRATKKTQTATPSSSNQVPTFNGKPVNDTLTNPDASASEKQAAWETKLKGAGRGSQSL